MDRVVIGVDVGTGSARAGVFDPAGRCLGRAQHPILLNRPQPDHAEHSSEDIWQAACRAVRDAVAAAGVAPEAVAGIGFDATCSLVVRDREGRPLSVSTTGEPRWDTIVWLDHRAVEQAETCTRSGHPVLDHVGGIMSPEMETPKLMWLKARLPGYDYDRHVGGALYLFLRGTRSASQGVYFTKPPRVLIEQLDRLFQGKPQPRVEPAWEQGELL